MKKKLLSILLTFCMALTLLPTAAFAEGNTEEELPAYTCKTACTAKSMNADCPVCGAKGVCFSPCAYAVCFSLQISAFFCGRYSRAVSPP